MTRTQIQLPDELYQRAKACAAQRELSLAEVIRRGLELFLERFPRAEPAPAAWTLPRVDAGGASRFPWRNSATSPAMTKAIAALPTDDFAASKVARM